MWAKPSQSSIFWHHTSSTGVAAEELRVVELSSVI